MEAKRQYPEQSNQYTVGDCFLWELLKTATRQSHNYGNELIFMIYLIVFCICFTGTASITVAGLLAALRITKTTLASHKFLFQGAGEVGVRN